MQITCVYFPKFVIFFYLILKKEHILIVDSKYKSHFCIINKIEIISIQSSFNYKIFLLHRSIRKLLMLIKPLGISYLINQLLLF